MGFIVLIAGFVIVLYLPFWVVLLDLFLGLILVGCVSFIVVFACWLLFCLDFVIEGLVMFWCFEVLKVCC